MRKLTVGTTKKSAACKIFHSSRVVFMNGRQIQQFDGLLPKRRQDIWLEADGVVSHPTSKHRPVESVAVFLMHPR